MPTTNTLVAENYEQKCLCVLVLDTSGSMSIDEPGSPIIPINELNKGLQRFQKELLSDSTTSDRLEVAIVTFDSEIKTVQQPALLTDFTMPTLELGGSTCMIDGISEAIDLVSERKQYYKDHGIPYCRPWIVMMTDGYPDDDQDVAGMSLRIKNAHVHKEFAFMPIGVGNNIKDDVMLDLAQAGFAPMRMKAVRFSEFFQWLSNSMVTLSHSKPGSNVTLPNPGGWLDDMIRDSTSN